MNVVESCASVKNAAEIFRPLCIFCGHNDAGIMYVSLTILGWSLREEYYWSLSCRVKPKTYCRP